MNNQPQRVLVVFGKLNRGGAETLAMNIYRNVDRKRLQFDFIKHTDQRCEYEDEIESFGGKIYSFPRYNGLNHFEYRKCWDKFLTEHPEYKIVHAHMTGSASVFIPIAKKHGCYTIAHSHIAKSQSGLRQKVIDMYGLPLRHMADYLFACSEIAGEWMFGKSVSKRANYKVVKNGVDTEKFTFRNEWREEIRKEFGLGNKFLLGNISRFHIQKNHSFLIDIFKAVHDKNSNSALILVGEGELKEEIRTKAEKLGLKNDVIFAGSRSDVNKILSAMDIFVMPSFREGLPVSLVEAQAAGVRIAATDAISQEIKLTDLVEMYPLDAGAEKWAEAVLKYADGYERRNTQKELKAAGYDIKSTANWLTDFYFKHM